MKKTLVFVIIGVIAMYALSNIAKANEITTPSASTKTLNLVKGSQDYYSAGGYSSGLSGGYSSGSNIKVCQY